VYSHCYQCTWYIGNRQIHDDLGVPYFSDHNGSLTERFNSKFADVGNSLVEQVGRHLRWPSVDLRPLIRGNHDRQLLVTRKVAVDTSNRANWHFFGYDEGWVFSLSCNTNARVWLAKTRHDPTFPKLGEFLRGSPWLTLVWTLWVRIQESLPT